MNQLIPRSATAFQYIRISLLQYIRTSPLSFSYETNCV